MGSSTLPSGLPQLFEQVSVVFRAHPRQSIVTPLAGDAIETVVHAAIDGDSAAATGSENHREDDALASAGSICGFGNRKAIGVVGAADFTNSAGLFSSQSLFGHCGD